MTDTIPGVQLHLRTTELKKDVAGRKRIELVLEAEIADEEVWKKVLAKLRDGLKIYSVEDFHTELRNTLAQENRELHEKNRDLSGQVGHLTMENRRMKDALSVLDQQLRGSG